MPFPQLCIDIRVAEQIHMIGAVRDRSVGFGNRQGLCRLPMLTERARDGYQTITEESIIEVSTKLARAGCECVTLDSFGQRNRSAKVADGRCKAVVRLPVFIQQISIAKICYASTS